VDEDAWVREEIAAAPGRALPLLAVVVAGP
jgi:hypothetical protein